MRIHSVADHNYSPIDNITASPVPRSIRVFYFWKVSLLSYYVCCDAALLELTIRRENTVAFVD